MNPLNYEILIYFLNVNNACAEDILNALEQNYGNRRDFTLKNISETLMTAKVNGILEETHYNSVNNEDEISIYYRLSEEGKAIINKYL